MPEPIQRTTFTVEVFSRGPLNLTERTSDSESDLAAIDYLISEGDCIGHVEQTFEMIVPPEAVEGELLRIGNDGEFFNDEPELVGPADDDVDEDRTCPECSAELLWDAAEHMWYCPNDWSHG